MARVAIASAMWAFYSTHRIVVPSATMVVELICGASPGDGSSSRSSRGRASRARDREHLLLSAGQRAGVLVQAFADPRKQLPRAVAGDAVRSLRR